MSTTGKFLEMRVNGSVLPRGITEWSVEEQGDDLDATDADSGGFEDTDVGVHGLRVTVRIVWSTADGAFPAMRRGTLLSNVALKQNSAQTIADYNIPTAIVTRVTRSPRVRGQREATFEFRSKGAFLVDGVQPT